MCLTPGISLTLRVYSQDDAWPTLFANQGGGQNRQSVLVYRKATKKTKEKNKIAIAVLDRCGNNWKNGKGGCGRLLHFEYAPTIATMFQPFVIESQVRKEC